jgi:phosphoenolpyruvate carboxykinase (GTP)
MEGILKAKCDDASFKKLSAIDNPGIHQFVARYAELCNPDRIFVCSDSAEDLAYVRQKAIDGGEERKLATPGHTIHFDGYFDQGRDKEHTAFLLPKGVDLGPNIRGIDKDEGTKEVHQILKGIMKGTEMYVRFFCLGPTNSPFSVTSLQLTDSAYVAHSLDLLYRQGYEEFKRQGRNARYFKVVHSQGELENATCKNIDMRRIYVDCEDEIVYSVNTQYGGNTLGLKKLSMRLAINRGAKEGWLTEHMLLMGIHGPKGRKTYFTGAFPSLCGKTSTSMMSGEKIVGDDIAYLRKIGGEVRAVNVEKGMFGIIMGINSTDDPNIWKALHTPNEQIIFSNILMTEEGGVHWIEKDGEVPKKGINYAGEWHPGKKGPDGKEVKVSHPNARFTLKLSYLDNLDETLDDPNGVQVGGFIYGGRDSDTWMPIRESFDWSHGVVTAGASLESETTAATLGKAGVRKFNPMSNLDFLSVPIGKYVQMNLDFAEGVKTLPRIFGVNYFLKDEQGNFLNAKTDKGIWLKWAELRVHGEVGAIETPIGRIPKYEDLKRLFKEAQNRDYTREDYTKQFSLRVPENLAKVDRILEIYKTKVPDSPQVVFETLEAEKKRLLAAKEKHGDRIEPEKFLS